MVVLHACAPTYAQHSQSASSLCVLRYHFECGFACHELPCLNCLCYAGWVPIMLCMSLALNEALY